MGPVPETVWGQQWEQTDGNVHVTRARASASMCVDGKLLESYGTEVT